MYCIGGPCSPETEVADLIAGNLNEYKVAPFLEGMKAIATKGDTSLWAVAVCFLDLGKGLFTPPAPDGSIAPAIETMENNDLNYRRATTAFINEANRVTGRCGGRGLQPVNGWNI